MEMLCTFIAYRGFESHPLLQKKDLSIDKSFFSYICLRQVILQRSVIWLMPSDIVLRTVKDKDNITANGVCNNTFALQKYHSKDYKNLKKDILSDVLFNLQFKI